MRSEGYGSCRVCVCVCVCVSVKRHLTSAASVCPENAVTYSAGNEGQKFCSVFSKTHVFPRSSAPSLRWPYIRSAIFPADNAHAHCAYASSARDAPCRKFSLRSVIDTIFPTEYVTVHAKTSYKSAKKFFAFPHDLALLRSSAHSYKIWRL